METNDINDLFLLQAVVSRNQQSKLLENYSYGRKLY